MKKVDVSFVSEGFSVFGTGARQRLYWENHDEFSPRSDDVLIFYRRRGLAELDISSRVARTLVSRNLWR